MKKITYILLLTSCTILHAQDSLRTIVIKLSPQHLLMRTGRFEIEKRILKSRNAYVIAPMLHFGDPDNILTTLRGSSNGQMVGVGVEVLHKIYTQVQRERSGIYFAYGLNYNHYDIKYNGFGWAATKNEDQLDIYEYKLLDQKQIINRIGFAALTGIEVYSSNYFVIDFYIGFGFKYSVIDAPNGDQNRYKANYLDYGFSGFEPRLGIKLGLLLF